MKSVFFSLFIVALFTSHTIRATEDSLVIDGKSYRVVEVNGQPYFALESIRTKSASTLFDVNHLPQKQPLHRGDILLQGVASPELRVSGTLFVETDERAAKSLAQRYGLIFKNSIGGVASLEAKHKVDINCVVSAMSKEGINVEVELAGQLQQPQ
ncbi:serine protease chaperone [Aeromonas salmonicida]